MPGLKHLLSTAFLTAFILPLTSAANYPTRSFIVQAYESPQPNTPLINYYLNAQGGKLFLTKDAPNPKPTLSVGRDGSATLANGNSIFLNTANGQLGYATSASALPPGAVLYDFLHLGDGNTPSLPTSSHVPGEPGGIFVWIGSRNDFWFACLTSAGQYSLFKQMTVTVPNLSGCDAIELAAENVPAYGSKKE